MKAWKITTVALVAIIVVLSAFIAFAYSPFTINVNKSFVTISGGEQSIRLTITGHLPGQSLKTFYFAISDYASGNFLHGYGSATNDSQIQTDIFGNFRLDYPHALSSIPTNYSINVTLVSENGVVIQKIFNIPAD